MLAFCNDESTLMIAKRIAIVITINLVADHGDTSGPGRLPSGLEFQRSFRRVTGKRASWPRMLVARFQTAKGFCRDYYA